MHTPEHSEIEEEVLNRIKPGDQLPRVITETLEEVQKQTDAIVMLAGSTAKGTYLAGDHDIDIFVRFESGTPNISEELEKTLTSVFDNVERIHGSRDYFSVTKGEYEFEFIPVIHITTWEKAENVTDMSPLHVEYVRNIIERHEWLADEVRLLKQFCKSAKVYGAESYVGGFSGYMVELLALHYGSFRKTLEAVSEWEPKVVIDPEEHHEDPVDALDSSKTFAPLILVDPVQQDRNAAAALTQAAFDRFVGAAQSYLKEENARFLEVIPLDPAAFRNSHKESRNIQVQLVPHKSKHDVMGAKCYKVFQHLARGLTRKDFTIIDAVWEFQNHEAVLLFAISNDELPEEETVSGPPVVLQEHAERFSNEHDEVFEKEGKLYAKEKRAYREPLSLLHDLAKERYISDRVKQIRISEL